MRKRNMFTGCQGKRFIQHFGHQDIRDDNKAGRGTRRGGMPLQLLFVLKNYPPCSVEMNVTRSPG